MNAIFYEPDVKDEWKKYIALNADYYKLSPAEFQAKYGPA